MSENHWEESEAYCTCSHKSWEHSYVDGRCYICNCREFEKDGSSND